MQYELYIDVFFLENFMMDFIVLMAVKRSMHKQVSGGSVCLGALMGALFASVLLLIPLSYAGKLALSHTLINSAMVIVGLRIRKLREYINSIISLYIFSFLIGGIISCIENVAGKYMKAGSLFFGIAVCSYFVFRKILDYLEALFKLPLQYCQVILTLKDKSCMVEALIDSGNNLSDNITGEPIHIITSKTIKKLTNTNKVQKIRYVPYHTIQEEQGVLPVIRLDKMQILGEKAKTVLNPVIGISSKEEFEGGKFEMILNPEDC